VVIISAGLDVDGVSDDEDGDDDDDAWHTDAMLRDLVDAQVRRDCVMRLAQHFVIDP